MRALLITLEGIQEVVIGSNAERTHALLEGTLHQKDEMDNLHSMYRLLECRSVTGAGYPDEHHAAWVDDEGLLTYAPGDQLNACDWYPQQPLVGKVLVTGFNPTTGETSAATMTVEELGKRVVVGFVRPKEVH